jgi:hypothetical protein
MQLLALPQKMKVTILVVALLVGNGFGQVSKKSTAVKKPAAKPIANQTLSKDFRTAGRRAMDAIFLFLGIPITR